MNGSFRASPSWGGARVAVIGLARSGAAACLFLRRRGARVTGTDRRSAPELGMMVEDLQAAGVQLSLGVYPDLGGFDALILSPGVDPSQTVIREARDKGVLILPELELGAREASGTIVCVTGTKGKSTTTMCLHAILREGGLNARAVGNIGEPITAHVDGSNQDSVFVIEASSFQLETTRDFRPDCAVFLNLFPDHLDRHPSFESYAAAKARIFSNQTPKDTAIVNGDDGAVMNLAREGRGSLLPFHPRTVPEPAADRRRSFFRDDEAVLQDSGTHPLFRLSDVQIPGAPVRANLLAAATAARHLGVKPDAIRKAIQSFRGIPHTFEKIGETGGVAYFNDSKATTHEAVQAALESFPSKVVVIMGGKLKAGSFVSLRETVARHARSVYAIGESRPLIAEAFAPVCPVHEAETLEEAVQGAHGEAKPGEAVLLSPGCASFDMFRDYAHRGEVFRRAFERLAMKGAA